MIKIKNLGVLLIAFAGFSGIDEQTVFAITDAAVVRVQIK
jgi:hypothetical protein